MKISSPPPCSPDLNSEGHLPEQGEFAAVLRRISVAALLALPVALTAVGQQPQFPSGFGRSDASQSRDPGESAAYSAAVGTSDPAARVSAIQQFLVKYPTSSLRQSALAQLSLAQRQSQNSGNASGMNRLAPPVPGPKTPPASTIVDTVSAPVMGPPADSLLQHSPRPAVIAVAPHSLSIKADNSTLSSILRDISTSTGMKVEGLGRDERIFGSYGPGEAHEVLLSLLEGCGYNVMMVGNTANGAPRELTLTQRSSALTQGSAQATRNANEEENDDSDQDVQQTPPPEPPQPPAPPPTENPQSRTPQEILQELQRMRQQNQNQISPPTQTPQ